MSKGGEICLRCEQPEAAHVWNDCDEYHPPPPLVPTFIWPELFLPPVSEEST